MSTEYQPGTCNIGQAERRQRYTLGVIGFVVAVGFVGASILWSLPRWSVLLVVFPLIAGFTGYVQGREGFCIGYALSGEYNFGDDPEAVGDESAKQEDLRRARMLLGKAIGAAIIVTGVLYFLAPL